MQPKEILKLRRVHVELTRPFVTKNRQENHPDGLFTSKPKLLSMGRDECGVPTAVEVMFIEFILWYAKNTKHQIVLNDGLDVYKFLYPIAH